jgi:hypothetical protein
VLAFNRDRCCHLALCLQLILFHYNILMNFPQKYETVTYRCSHAFGAQEDVDDAAIAEERDGPQDKEDDTKEINDEWMLWRESTPVGVDHTLQVLRKVVQM